MKHILITGGTDGIGKAAAQKLHQGGHAVTILGREENKTKQIAGEIGCAYVVADVADYEQVAAAVEMAETTTGPIDVLVNNAGIWMSAPITEADPAEIHRVIEVNTLGTIYGCRAVAPAMVERKQGRIINVISQAGLQTSPNRTVYHASKWAITGFTKALKDELRGSHIAVTGFYPGAINTQFFAKQGDMKDRSTALAPDAAADVLVYLCNLPDDIEVPELGVQSLNY